MNFLDSLIEIGELAGRIAVGIRADPELFPRLVETKKLDEKNPKFARDFKTLADVLIQELARVRISKNFPQIADRIYGEESNHMTNSTGESITIRVDDRIETNKCLLKMLNEDLEAATRLTNLVHGNGTGDKGWTPEIDLDLANLAIWIDPIDGTNVFVDSSQSKLHQVTILLGAFSISSGRPVAGVVVQPFAKVDTQTDSVSANFFWGAINGYRSITSPNISPAPSPEDNLRVIVSESEPMISKLRQKCTVITASGAGFKLLALIQNSADVYLCSSPTVYFYDTCAPHAILEAMDSEAGILNFEKVRENLKGFLKTDDCGMRKEFFEKCRVSYSEKCAGLEYCHTGGILAYNNKMALVKFLGVVADIVAQ